MSNLQESIKRGQRELDEKSHLWGYKEHRQFLDNFARRVATDMIEALDLAEEPENAITTTENERLWFTRGYIRGYNRVVQTQSQLINNYLGEKDNG